MSTTTDLSTLKINYLTQSQFDTALDNNQINENEIYLTPTEDMTTQEVDDFVNELEVGGSDGIAVDLVVEQGIGGDFQYRKWNSGAYEAWTSFTATNLSLTTVSNNTYYGGNPTYLTLPSFSIAVDCVTSGVNSPTSSSVYVYRAYANDAGTQISVEFRAHASVSGGTCGASIYVRGRWK